VTKPRFGGAVDELAAGAEKGAVACRPEAVKGSKHCIKVGTRGGGISEACNKDPVPANLVGA
jgi:hypothetical protein